MAAKSISVHTVYGFNRKTNWVNAKPGPNTNLDSCWNKSNLMTFEQIDMVIQEAFIDYYLLNTSDHWSNFTSQSKCKSNFTPLLLKYWKHYEDYSDIKGNKWVAASATVCDSSRATVMQLQLKKETGQNSKQGSTCVEDRFKQLNCLLKKYLKHSLAEKHRLQKEKVRRWTDPSCAL